MARKRRFTLLFSEAEFAEAEAFANLERVSLASLIRTLLRKHGRAAGDRWADGVLNRRAPTAPSDTRGKSPKPEGTTR